MTPSASDSGPGSSAAPLSSLDLGLLVLEEAIAHAALLCELFASSVSVELPLLAKFYIAEIRMLRARPPLHVEQLAIIMLYLPLLFSLGPSPPVPMPV